MLVLVLTALAPGLSPATYASVPTPPCSGSPGLLERPTIRACGCVVAERMTVLEAGGDRVYFTAAVSVQYVRVCPFGRT